MRRLMLICCLLLPATATAQVMKDRPAEIVDVGFVDCRGEQLPLALTFTDSTGTPRRLATLFDGERPVILSFNYATCPMLCRLQLDGLVDGLREVPAGAGDDYRVVSISIDPAETVAQAAASKQNHVNAYGRPGSGSGWEFLTGDPDSIRAVTQAAGFRYQFLRSSGEYSHAAGVIVCTPSGKISQYLYGVKYPPATLRLAITEAGGGQIGSALDQLLLFCFRYDESSGQYTPVAKNIMRVGALCTVFALCVSVVPMWLRGRRSSRPQTQLQQNGGAV
ncbi:MAG: SCO family protein [Planctomycetaceae bacterium]|nr:SCO family protein [Planctomycetaceae bacterium]